MAYGYKEKRGNSGHEMVPYCKAWGWMANHERFPKPAYRRILANA